MNPVLLPALIELGIISWRTLTGTSFAAIRQSGPSQSGPLGLTIQRISIPKRPPLPSELLAVVGMYGVYSFIAETDSGRTIGSLLAWGTTLATFLLSFGGNTQPVGQQAGNFQRGGR